MVFPKSLFQQDNLTCHIVIIIQNSVEDHDNEFKVLTCSIQKFPAPLVLTWPTNFPDLNPIKHL